MGFIAIPRQRKVGYARKGNPWRLIARTNMNQRGRVYLLSARMDDALDRLRAMYKLTWHEVFTYGVHPMGIMMLT